MEQRAPNNISNKFNENINNNNNNYNYDNDGSSNKRSNKKSSSNPAMCVKCRNHRIHSIKKGHKKRCRFSDCECPLCVLNERRRYWTNLQKKESNIVRPAPIRVSTETDKLSSPLLRVIETEKPTIPSTTSVFTPPFGRLDPSKKDKAVKDFENSLKKLGDPDYRQLLLGHALLEICKYDMEDVSRRIQSGTQELLDRMNTILGIDSDDDYVDVNFYTDDEDDEDEDEIPEVEPCPRSLE